MKKLIAFILVLSSVLTLCACGAKKTASEGKELSLVDKKGQARFTIISYSKAGSVVNSVTSLLSAELRKNVGGVFRVTYVPANNDDKDGYYFLIGNTGREESKTLAEGIAENEYRVKVMGRRIVVVGGSDIALSRGVGALLAAIDYSKKSISKTLDITGTVGGHSEMLVGMANQTTKCVEVYDISSGKMDATSLVWSSNPTPGISGFKLRNHPTYGDVVLITVGTHVEMVSYETKEILWQINNAPENSHSVELMPNGVIAVGGTVGHDIHFYNLNSADPTEIKLEIPYKDAHGVLWDPKNELLWAAGMNMLYAYKVTANDDGSVTVTKDEEMSYTTPDSGLHDLQPYFGNDDWLIVSTASHVYIYDKVNKTVKDAYEGVTGATTNHVKGVGRFLNGDQIYMFYDGGDDNGQGGGWNTTYLTYIANGSNIVGTIPSNMGRFYKCRVWYSNYQ